LGGFLAGAAIGFGLGWLFALFRNSWNGVTAMKRGTDAATKGAWRRTRELVLLGFLLLVAAAMALGHINER
jgi:protein-S-isoprenylcysteine O-methyltransferase Ste14